LENFIHEQNMMVFRRLLAEEPDMNQKRRKMILKLLSEEEAKGHQPFQRNPSDHHQIPSLPGGDKQ
jgi:hypothetical protein